MTNGSNRANGFQAASAPDCETAGTSPVKPEHDRRLQAVIFDVDGTLAETELNGHRVAFNRAFTEFDLDWHWSPEYYGELLTVTGGKERLRLHIESTARLARADAQALLARPDLDRWIARLHQRKTEIYTALALSGSIGLRPGVARLIAELRAANIRLAIATTTTRACLDSLIKANFGCATSDLFAVVGAGDQVASKKPAPDIYQWVLSQLELPPGRCFAIEDSQQGLAAARAASIATLVTVNAYTESDQFSGAHCVIDSLGEPGQPAHWLAGQALDGALVDLAQLQKWLLGARQDMNDAGRAINAN